MVDPETLVELRSNICILDCVCEECYGAKIAKPIHSQRDCDQIYISPLLQAGCLYAVTGGDQTLAGFHQLCDLDSDSPIGRDKEREAEFAV